MSWGRPGGARCQVHVLQCTGPTFWPPPAGQTSQLVKQCYSCLSSPSISISYCLYDKISKQFLKNSITSELCILLSNIWTILFISSNLFHSSPLSLSFETFLDCFPLPRLAPIHPYIIFLYPTHPIG